MFMGSKPSDAHTLIQSMCDISSTVGHRLGQVQIDRLVPIFLRFCDPADAVSGNDNGDLDSDILYHGDNKSNGDEAAMALANELRESCLPRFQSFVTRCQVEVQPHVSDIIHAALAYMRHDPNYSYDDKNEENPRTGDDCSMERIMKHYRFLIFC